MFSLKRFRRFTSPKAVRRSSNHGMPLALESLEDRLALTIYNVGPGLAYTTIGAVPWNNLQPGDTVDIHWQSGGYHEKLYISSTGTASQPITINGIPNSQGQLPIVDGSNATTSPNMAVFGYTPLQDFGEIIIYRNENQSTNYFPGYITINDLQIQGAVGGTSYQGYGGTARTYLTGAAGIWTEGCSNITIHGCTITNNDNGVFASVDPGGTYDSNIMLDSNYIYGNGVSGSDRQHNTYIEADGAIYQYNYYGPLRAGSLGNSLKDRSAGTVIRYNFIESSDPGHLLDLVDAEDSIGGLTSLPSYLQTFVYGNTLVSTQNGPVFLVHYGGDSTLYSTYRNGTLYFYDNTVINQADQSARWRTNVLELDTNQQSVDARNNIFYNTSQTPGATPTLFEFATSQGNINFATSNWVSPGWLSSYIAEVGGTYNGTISGTGNFFVDPNNNPSFTNLATYDAYLLAGSNAIGLGGPLAAVAAASYPVTEEYVYNQSSQARSTISDLGAFAYAGSSTSSASSLALSASTTSSPAGSSFTITVTAETSSGTTATNYLGTVHFTSSDAQAVLPANYTFTAADAGVHTFSVTLKTAGTESVTATDTSTGTVAGTASGITVTPGAASVLIASGFPSPATAGVAGTITVTAEDAYGNVATGYRGTAHLSSSDAQALLPANYTFTATDAGIHTFSVTLKTAGSDSLTATDTTTSSITGSQGSIIVNAAVASVLVLSGFPTSITAGVAGTITVTVRDAFGNLATGYRGIEHFTSSDAQALLPANYTFTATDAGVHTFSVTLKTAESDSLTATDTTTSSLTGTQGSITVNPAAASTLVLSGFPASITAGVAGTITVTARDAFGNLATGYRGTDHFTSSDAQAALPANYTFTATDAGVHTFSITLKTAGSDSLSATDNTTSTLTGSQGSITVNPAAASTLVFSGFPASGTAGVAGTISVTARDAFGNVSTGYRGTEHLASSDAQAVLPANYTFTATDAGVHTFSITLKTAGNDSLTATDTTTSSITGSQSITVNPAAASTMVLVGFPSSNTAGVAGTVTVTTKDAFGNTASGYRGTVHFTSSDAQAALPANYTFTAGDAGVHSFSVTLKTAGTDSLTATDTVTSAFTSTQGGITVNAAAASTLVLAGFPAATTAGVAGTVTVTVKDSFGNTASAYRGTVHFTSSDAQAALPANYSFTAADGGVHTFSLTLKTAGTDSLTASDTSTSTITGLQGGINVNPAAGNTLVLAGFPRASTAGVAGTITVTAKDSFGNIASGYRGTIHFTSSDGQATLSADYTFTAADAGVHSFNVTLKTAGSDSITATDTATGSITGTQGTISINAAAASTVILAGFPTATAAGVAGTITVTTKDPFGNTASGYRGAVHFTSSDGQALLPADYVFTASDAGVHAFGVTLRTAGSDSITATDSLTSTITGSQGGIVVSPAAASALVLTGFPSSISSGVAGTISVTAKDVFGNSATGYRGTIHFTSSDPTATLPANYTFLAADGGTHSFSATLLTTGAQSLTATDVGAGSLSGTESNIAVLPFPFLSAQGLAITGTEGQTFGGSVATFVTTGGSQVSGNFTASIDWGDGKLSAGTVVAGSGGSFTVTGSHAYLALGQFTVNITIRSNVGTSTSATAQSSVDTADQRFVIQLYHDLLGRAADPAGLAAWSGQLDQGTATRQQVATAVVGSQEYRTDEINNLYQTILGRTADPSGLQSWLNFLAQGDTAVQVEAQLLSSPEFFTNGGGGSNATFLAAIYEDVLHRPIDPSGANSMGQELTSGVSRLTVVQQVLGSKEAESDLVRGAYQQLLHRSADSAGLQAFVALLQNGGSVEQITVALTSSQEYAQACGGDATLYFVQNLYTDLLNRPLDASAQATFVGGLDNAPLTRGQIVQDLLTSNEYRSDVVQSLYQGYLHRAADPSSLTGFTTLLANGSTDEGIAALLAGSTEFFNDNGSTNPGFVSALYQDALGRAADPAGLAFWESALQTGMTRTQAATAIFGSTEYMTDLVQKLYQRFLGRPADNTGLNAFVPSLEKGAHDESVIAALVSSVEYYAR